MVDKRAETVPAAVRDAASRFRQAFDEQRSQLVSRTFQDFPRGSCGDASELLGQYLQDSGLGQWQYVSGALNTHDRFQSHAWVERDGLIVDITADQFLDVHCAVLITYDPTWHAQFGASKRHVASLDYYVRADNNRDINADYLVLSQRADELRSSGGAV